ncbi:MAG: hypothetical protein IJM97_03270 [Clostridia bacterium]|nr:hypothetical protein [Clostridia bacterium]
MPELVMKDIKSKMYSENLDWGIDCDNEKSCMVFSLSSSYSGEKAPSVTFQILTQDGESLYHSHSYTVGKCNEVTANEWRIPPLVFKNAKCYIHFTIPEGTQLNISDYSIRYEDYNKPITPDLKFNAHLGFFGVAPENTIPAFELAGLCGFDSCITVPKLTKDGVFVCIHDDTINSRARDNNGNKPEEEMRVSDMTYEELLKWDFGLWKHPAYKNTKIPTLQEFFKICHDYNMKPFFSIHPNFTDEEWQQVRKMLIDHDLLDKFQVKSYRIDVLESVFRVFGNDINCYTLWSKVYNDDMIEKLSSLNLDLSKVRGVIEIQEKSDMKNFNEDMVERIKAAGFTPSAICCWGRKTGEYYQRLISLGVNEFTEDYHCSFELNW